MPRKQPYPHKNTAFCKKCEKVVRIKNGNCPHCQSVLINRKKPKEGGSKRSNARKKNQK